MYFIEMMYIYIYVYEYICINISNGINDINCQNLYVQNLLTKQNAFCFLRKNRFHFIIVNHLFIPLKKKRRILLQYDFKVIKLISLKTKLKSLNRIL